MRGLLASCFKIGFLSSSSLVLVGFHEPLLDGRMWLAASSLRPWAGLYKAAEGPCDSTIGHEDQQHAMAITLEVQNACAGFPF